jgi:hypothetical protein
MVRYPVTVILQTITHNSTTQSNKTQRTNVNGATSVVVYVNNAIFLAGAKLPEHIPLVAHLELVEICQSYIYILREV